MEKDTPFIMTFVYGWEHRKPRRLSADARIYSNPSASASVAAYSKSIARPCRRVRRIDADGKVHMSIVTEVLASSIVVAWSIGDPYFWISKTFSLSNFLEPPSGLNSSTLTMRSEPVPAATETFKLRSPI